MRIAVIASSKEGVGEEATTNKMQNSKSQLKDDSSALPAIPDRNDELEPYSVGAGFRHSWGKLLRRHGMCF